MRFGIYYLLILLIFTYSCSDDGITPERNKLKVAAILDMSGHYGQFGSETKQGLDLFLELNGESLIEIIYYDSKGSSETASEIFDVVSADTNVKVIITLASWISNTLAPAAEAKGILHFAVGSAVFDYPNNGNCIRFTGDVKDESAYLINYLKDYDNAALIYFDNDYGKGWHSRMSEELGTKLTISRSYSDTDTDFTSIINDVKQVNPEVLVMISTIEAVQISRQVKEASLNSMLLGNRPILTEGLINEPAADGLIFSYPDLDENHQGYKAYIAKYSKKPSSFTAEGYDLAASLHSVVGESFDKNKVYNYYKNLTWKGIFTEIKFDSNAQANSKYNLMIIKNNDYQDYK
ncbi:MAG: ABC transporter substrate-binding protein [Candidatus Kapaibacterium sp.]